VGKKSVEEKSLVKIGKIRSCKASTTIILAPF